METTCIPHYKILYRFKFCTFCTFVITIQIFIYLFISVFIYISIYIFKYIYLFICLWLVYSFICGMFGKFNLNIWK